MVLKLKKRVAIILIIAMAFTNGGFATLASSIEPTVNVAINSNKEETSKKYYVESIDKSKLIIEESVDEEFEETEDIKEEPESDEEESQVEESSEEETYEDETPVVETSGNKETESSGDETEQVTVENESIDDTETIVESESATENGDITESKTITTVVNEVIVESKSTENDENAIASGSIVENEDIIERKSEVASESEIENAVEIKVATKSVIASDSEIESTFEEFVASDSEAILATNSNLLLGEANDLNDKLLGAGDKYILPANWTKGSGITKNRIDKIEILYYGKDAPTWYNISWNIEGSNGLRAYKKSSYIYIYGHQKIKIFI